MLLGSAVVLTANKFLKFLKSFQNVLTLVAPEICMSGAVSYTPAGWLQAHIAICKISRAVHLI